MASEWERKMAERVTERIWSDYDSSCAAEGSDGCEHTPDGDPLICWACRERKHQLVAEHRIAVALNEARQLGRDEGEERGAQRERWECHKIVRELDPETGNVVTAMANLLALRKRLEELEQQSEPKPLKLGHEFDALYHTAHDASERRCARCGQPREAH